MKTAFRLIIAAMAASVALVSCSKDDLEPKETEIHPLVTVTDGSRVIKVSFGPETKSTLVGFQPKFKAGDLIAVSNGVNDPENCIVKVDDSGKAYITTNLMGALTAVYPASAADINSNGKQIDGIKVLATQSGKFADANICQAVIQNAATTATFKNEVAILKFYVDKSIGVKKITVSSTSDLAAGSSKSITVDPEGDKTINEITDDPQDRICYVAVLPGDKTNLKFSSTTTTQGNSPVERTLASATLEKNWMYNAFIPYYIDLGKAGKWAYCNIGAFLPEEPGKYFAWGDTQGQSWSGSAWSGSGFETAPVLEPLRDTLALENDAANVLWGGSWRMPTKAQLDTLAAATKVWSTEAKGYKLYTASADTSIFLPAAGSSADMSKVGTSGDYWSSSLNAADEKTLAYKLGISNGSAETATMDRKVGATIRPFRHIPVDRIELNKAKDTVKINDVATLIATIYPANASDTLVTWTSSNTAVATVDQRGHITGVSGGTATITARIIDLNGTEKSTTCDVKVPAEITSVTLNKTSIAALKVGSDETLSISEIAPTTAIIVSTTWSSNNTSIATVDQSGKVTGKTTGNTTIKVTVKDVYNIEVTQTCSVEVKPNVPEGAISGKFSVSASKQVYFSKGNLKYDVSSKKWAFYEHQYDYNKSNEKTAHESLITLFTWGYDAQRSINPEDMDYTSVSLGGALSKTQDWGCIFGDESSWRTLTKAEWEYLLNHNKYKNNVSVCGNEQCLVLAPESFNGTIADSYDTNTWATAESNGLVCLPPAGTRIKLLSINVTTTVVGCYWTLTSHETIENTSYELYFNGDDASTPGPMVNGRIKNNGIAVRLVTDVE